MKDKKDDELKKKELEDLEHLLNKDLGSLLMLNNEGTPEQVAKAKQDLHSHVQKYSAEMEKLAESLNPQTAELVKKFMGALQDFLKTIDTTTIDPAKINDYHKIQTVLHEVLKGGLRFPKK